MILVRPSTPTPPPLPQPPRDAPLPEAALTAEPCPNMSERYVHIDTRDVVRYMKSEGWHLAATRAAQPRVRDPLYATHMLDFRRPDDVPIRGAAPRIIIVNSHNGTTSARAMAGFFRFVCANGLVVGHETGHVVARHAGADALQFVHEVQRLERVLAEQRSTLQRWAGRRLNLAQREEYARLVAQLRYGSAWAAEPHQILALRREEDDDGTLFSAFNRAQENTTRGGFIGRSRTGRRVTARPLTGIMSDLTYNERLWRMTAELADHW